MKFIGISLLSIAILSGCLGYAYFVEPHRLVTNRQTIKITGWDTAFEGYKIIAIGDIHGGSNGVDDTKLRTIVETANAENADLIVLLGDYVSQNAANRSLGDAGLRMPMPQIADGLKGLTAKDGVVAVLGNHDGWYCDDCVRSELNRVGITVLDNEILRIERGGKAIRIFGLPDHMKIGNWRSFSNNAKQTLANTNEQGNVIALDHSPDILPVITGDLSISTELKLVLAAHTHGGQVWLPVIGSPIVPTNCGQKCAYGLSSLNGVEMFVTSGVGESILPFRFMMPPEIAVLTVKAEN